MIDALDKAIGEALDDPGLQEQLRNQGAQVYRTTPAEFDEIIRGDIERWIELDEQAGIASSQ